MPTRTISTPYAIKAITCFFKNLKIINEYCKNE